MFTSQGLLDSFYVGATKTPSDSVGDIHVRTTFSVDGTDFVVDNFKVFAQTEGYRSETVKHTNALFQLWGAPDYSHMGLYQIADKIHSGIPGTSSDVEFDTYVEIYQEGLVFRVFNYHGCTITGYTFTTLHDDDETFSGKTQFVYADVFQIQCDGYVDYSPFLLS